MLYALALAEGNATRQIRGAVDTNAIRDTLPILILQLRRKIRQIRINQPG